MSAQRATHLGDAGLAGNQLVLASLVTWFMGAVGLSSFGYAAACAVNTGDIRRMICVESHKRGHSISRERHTAWVLAGTLGGLDN